MATAQKIHIALAFDDVFWAPAFALMRSICIHSSFADRVVFHLFEYEVSQSHRADLDRIGDEFGAKIIHYDVLDLDEYRKAAASFPVRGNLHSIIYARLFLHQYVPQNVHRIIYLDCDTMVFSPIEAVFDIDLEGKTIGAVYDLNATKWKLGQDMIAKSDVFQASDHYFNSGVMVMDLERIRRVNILEKLNSFQETGLIDRLYYDQDMLNLIFRNDWRNLGWRFNVMDPQKAHETMQVKIIHFTGINKPWKLLTKVAFASAYRHLMTHELFYRYWRYRSVRLMGKPFRFIRKLFRALPR